MTVEGDGKWTHLINMLGEVNAENNCDTIIRRFKIHGGILAEIEFERFGNRLRKGSVQRKYHMKQIAC
jgi:hypothetical protein